MSAELVTFKTPIRTQIWSFTILDSISRLTSICFKVGHNPIYYPSTI